VNELSPSDRAKYRKERADWDFVGFISEDAVALARVEGRLPRVAVLPEEVDSDGDEDELDSDGEERR
jgi:hypothetical protein